MRAEKVNQQILNQCVKLYGIVNPSIKQLEGGIENPTFLISDEKYNYVLKLYPVRDEITLKHEIEVINYLLNRGLPVPKIYLSQNKRYYEKVNDKYICLFSFVVGNPLPKPVNPSLARDVGRKLGQLQKELGLFDPSYHYKVSPANNFAEFRGKYKFIDSFLLVQKYDIVRELEKVVLNGLRKQYIHGDINRENLLVLDGKVVAFLDFGDSHYDYLVWDTATAITQLFITKTYGIDWTGFRNFLIGYKGLMNLNEDEINAIVPFLKLRNFKVAMQVNYMRNREKGEKERLLSIESSVLRKIKLIKEHEDEIRGLIDKMLKKGCS